MKTIILLAGFGKRLRPHTWSRPKPIVRVAGSTIVGRVIDVMASILTDEVIFVVGYKGEQIEQWIREIYPDLDSHFVVQEDPLGQAHAVWLCREFLDDSPVVVAFGDGIIKADYAAFPKQNADVVFLVKEVEDPRRFGVAVLDENGLVTRFIEKPPTVEHKLAVAGITWFRSGAQLVQAINDVLQQGKQTLGEYFMADAYERLLEQGAKMRTLQLEQWADAGTEESLLETNARLLSVGYGTQDALERSFADGFTVIPPVFIDPAANISASVIGPYASIYAGAEVANSIIRNSIIDPGAVIKDCVLENSLVGERAQVAGARGTIFIGDDSALKL